MSGIKTLVRHSSHYISGQVCLMAIGLVSFPVFTRMLSVADYGMMELVQRLALVGTAAGKLGVQHAVLRFYQPKEFAADPGAARRFISTGVLGPAGAALLAGLLAALAFVLFGGKGNPATLALLTAALAAIRVLISILQTLLRVEEKAAFASWINVAGRVVTVTTIISLFTLVSPNLPTYFTGTVIVEFGVVCLLAWLLFRRGLIKIGSFDKSLYWQMVAFGLPMVAYETVLVTQDSADRFLIRNIVGATPLGYYAAAYTICTYIQDILMVPIQMAMMPIYMRLWNTEGPERTAEFLTDSFRLFVVAATCLVAGVAACASPAVLLLASAKYADSAKLIPWIVGGLVFYAGTAFFNAPLWIEKRTKKMAQMTFIALVVKVALNLILLPRLGLAGAVVSSITGYVLLFGMTYTAATSVMKIGVDFGLVIKSILSAAMAAFIGVQIHLGSAAGELLTRAVVVASVFAALLMLADTATRQQAQQGLAWLRRSMMLRFAAAPAAGGLK